MIVKVEEDNNFNGGNAKRLSDEQISEKKSSIISENGIARPKNRNKKVHFQLGLQRFYNLIGLLQVTILK